MAWPPPLMMRPVLMAWRTARPRSTPVIERPEPVPMPPGSSAMAKAGRPNRSFNRAATRPTTPRCQPSAAGTTAAPLPSTPRAATERGHGLGLGLRQGGELDRLAFAVESIEFGREPRAFGRIVLHEQIDPEGRPADAASGIDARSQEEAEMPRLGRAAEPRDIHQGGEPDIVAPAQRQQSLG